MTNPAETSFTPDRIDDIRAGFDPDGTLAHDLADLWSFIAADVPAEVRRFWAVFADNPAYRLSPERIEKLIVRDIAYTARKYQGPFDQELIDQITYRGRQACRDRGTEVRFAGALLAPSRSGTRGCASRWRTIRRGSRD